MDSGANVEKTLPLFKLFSTKSNLSNKDEKAINVCRILKLIFMNTNTAEIKNYLHKL